MGGWHGRNRQEAAKTDLIEDEIQEYQRNELPIGFGSPLDKTDLSYDTSGDVPTSHTNT